VHLSADLGANADIDFDGSVATGLATTFYLVIWQHNGQCVYVVFVCEVARLHVFVHFISIRFLSRHLAMGKRKCVFNVNL
jgi:hypothetical protein